MRKKVFWAHGNCKPRLRSACLSLQSDQGFDMQSRTSALQIRPPNKTLLFFNQKILTFFLFICENVLVVLMRNALVEASHCVVSAEYPHAFS